MRLSLKPAVRGVAAAALAVQGTALGYLAITAGSPATAAAAIVAAPSYTSPDYRHLGGVNLRFISYTSYRVERGDTLSGIAATRLGSASRWESLYAANRQVIGSDPDKIFPGQQLQVDQPAAGSPPPAGGTQSSRVSHGSGRYGHPYYCGDGDGDGWDLPCSALHRGSSRNRSQSRTTAASYHPPRYSGIFSFSGLESLWRWAGGPSWAAWSAATIAECESGGNPRAYNPSGASGIWQILGVPFPGNPFDPYTNARMAVAKFRGAGGNFSPWVCRA